MGAARGGDEGEFGVAAAIGAFNGGIGPLAASGKCRAGQALLPPGLASLATLRFVLEVFLGVEKLFARRPH